MQKTHLRECIALTEGVITEIVPTGFGRARMTIVYKVNNLLYCFTENVRLHKEDDASKAMTIDGINSTIILRYIPETPSIAYSPILFSKNNKIFIKNFKNA